MSLLGLSDDEIVVLAKRLAETLDYEELWDVLFWTDANGRLEQRRLLRMHLAEGGLLEKTLRLVEQERHVWYVAIWQIFGETAADRQLLLATPGLYAAVIRLLQPSPLLNPDIRDTAVALMWGFCEDEKIASSFAASPDVRWLESLLVHGTHDTTSAFGLMHMLTMPESGAVLLRQTQPEIVARLLAAVADRQQLHPMACFFAVCSLAAMAMATGDEQCLDAVRSYTDHAISDGHLDALMSPANTESYRWISVEWATRFLKSSHVCIIKLGLLSYLNLLGNVYNVRLMVETDWDALIVLQHYDPVKDVWPFLLPFFVKYPYNVPKLENQLEFFLREKKMC